MACLEQVSGTSPLLLHFFPGCNKKATDRGWSGLLFSTAHQQYNWLLPWTQSPPCRSKCRRANKGHPKPKGYSQGKPRRARGPLGGIRMILSNGDCPI